MQTHCGAIVLINDTVSFVGTDPKKFIIRAAVGFVVNNNVFKCSKLTDKFSFRE